MVWLRWWLTWSLWFVMLNLNIHIFWDISGAIFRVLKSIEHILIISRLLLLLLLSSLDLVLRLSGLFLYVLVLNSIEHILIISKLLVNLSSWDFLSWRLAVEFVLVVLISLRVSIFLARAWRDLVKEIIWSRFSHSVNVSIDRPVPCAGVALTVEVCPVLL